MKLSVIIVNYNVKYFLEQCLYSVYAASKRLDVEIFVVDNNSVDGSTQMLNEKFPEVHLIENKENVGFSKANNQAIRLSKGEYILLLNPDTLVEEDTFSKCIHFMDAHPDAGGLGVKMIDGKGNYLPESKRGFPTPEVAFYKISGLTKLFPKSKKYARYYLGHLSSGKTNEIEILAGAYMMMRKSVLDEIGLLDETFFMYGEDIDLSYRIIKGGYKNYYFPETRIIHYKGESTKKGSLNYVFTFYNAMAIFARKHLSKGNAKIFSLAIKTAIWLRASLSFVERILKNTVLPLADFLIIWIGFYVVKNFWATHIISENINYYPPEYIGYVVPIYIIIWLACVFFSGGYDKPVRLGRILKGLLIGTIAVLVFYSLMSAEYRFSRALILLGALWAAISMPLLRLILHFSGIKSFRLFTQSERRYIVVGEKNEAKRVASLLKSTSDEIDFIGLVNTKPDIDSDFIGTQSQLQDIIRLYKIDEIIFCSKSLQPQEIISLMSALQQTHIDFKIAPPESLFIIGSNSINSTEDLYVIGINSINQPQNKRNKRFFDISTSMAFLITSPVLIFFQKCPKNFFLNVFNVLLGKKTWVGYYDYKNAEKKLPQIKEGILSPIDIFPVHKIKDETIDRLNLLYARNYKVGNDFQIVFKNLRNLGKNK